MEKITKNVQLVLLIIILISTIIAVGIEIYTMFVNNTPPVFIKGNPQATVLKRGIFLALAWMFSHT